MSEEKRRPSDSEYGRPLPKPKPLPFLPEREWLYGRISKAEYEYVYYQGKIQYLTDKDTKESILDPETKQPIERRQFAIEIELRDFSLPNGEPRRAWIKLGASMGAKANLPQFLRNLGFEEQNPTVQEILDFLKGIEVKLQMANKVGKTSGEDYQAAIWDSVKPA